LIEFLKEKRLTNQSLVDLLDKAVKIVDLIDDKDVSSSVVGVCFIVFINALRLT